MLRDSLGLMEHAAALFGRIREYGHTRHVCLACNRALPSEAMPAFDAHVAMSLQRSQPERIAELQRDLHAWTQLQTDLHTAQSLETQCRDAQADYDAAQAHRQELEQAHKQAQHARDEARVRAAEAQRRYEAARALQDEAQRIADVALDLASLEQRLGTLPASVEVDVSPTRMKALVSEMCVGKLTQTIVSSAPFGVVDCPSSASRCM